MVKLYELQPFPLIKYPPTQDRAYGVRLAAEKLQVTDRPDGWWHSMLSSYPWGFHAFKLGSLAGLFFVVIDLCERRIAALNLAALRTRCSLKTFSSNWETGTETTVLFNIPCPFCIWWLPWRANPPRFTTRSSSQTSLLKIYSYKIPSEYMAKQSWT